MTSDRVRNFIKDQYPTYEEQMKEYGIEWRTQNETEKEREKHGQLSAFDPSPTDSDPDRTQHEFRKDVDTGEILKRHARGEIIPAQQPLYGRHDGDMTLLGALEGVRQARSAYQRLPESVRQKWGTWEQVLQAADRGEIAIVDGKLQHVTKQKPEEKPLDKAATP